MSRLFFRTALEICVRDQERDRTVSAVNGNVLPCAKGEAEPILAITFFKNPDSLLTPALDRKQFTIHNDLGSATKDSNLFPKFSLRFLLFDKRVKWKRD